MKGTMAAIHARLLQEPSEAEQAAWVQAEAENERKREAAKRQGLFGDFIGDRRQYEDCSFGGWKVTHTAQKPIVAALGDYCDSLLVHYRAGEGCVFYGPPGTGKDYLATIVAREACLSHGICCRYINGMELFVRLRDSMENERTSEVGIVNECVTCGFLIVSDPLPPTGDLTSYQASMLYRVIDDRNSRRLPTIVTLNVSSGEEAIRRMGGATWDRIRHNAWAFACNWPSFRKPARVIGE
jgi:DNA replication protein DnaC